MLIQSKGHTLNDQIKAGTVDKSGTPINSSSTNTSTNPLGNPSAEPLATATQPAGTLPPVTPSSPQPAVNTPAQTPTAAPGTPGSYKGVPITPGTDAEIQAQLAKIDANQGKQGDIVINQKDTTTQTQTPPPNTPPEAQNAPPAAAPADPYAKLEDQISVAQKQIDATNNDYQAKANQVSKTITNIQNGIIPLNDGEQAQVAGLQQSYQTLIEQQQLQNTAAAGQATVRGYQTGAAEYDPTFSIKTIGNIVSAGNQKVADLNTQMASAVAALTQGFKDSDIAAVKDSWAVYQDAADKRTTALQKTIDDANAAIKDAQDAQQKIQDNIDTVAEKAAENGADAATLAKINAAGSTGDAISAAGVYLQSATGQLGDYLQYKKDTIQQGLTPSDYASWKAADDARQAKADANAAYSKAYATAQGAAAATGTADGSSDITPDPTSGGITQAAGISLQAFNYLTQGTASMSRMSAAQRNQIIGEADAFLKKNNIDVSTFQSQYKAYNDVLEQNVERANNTKIFGDEISGTVDQFVNDIGSDFGSLNAGNVAKLFAGKQVNDPTVQKYAFDLRTMQNDLAGYYAASRGANSPDQADLEAATQVITNGISSKSALAFQQAINDNEKKVSGVVNTAVDSAQKSVWDLFGVGAQYQPKGAQVNPKNAVDSYVQENPDKATLIGNLYNVPGTTDQDVLDYINHAFSPQ